VFVCDEVVFKLCIERGLTRFGVTRSEDDLVPWIRYESFGDVRSCRTRRNMECKQELSILSASNQSLIAVLTDKSGTNEDDLAFPLDRLLRCPRRRRIGPGSRRQGLCCQSGCGRRGRLVHVVCCLIRCHSLEDVAQVQSDLVQSR
jgi:hypothetical protein